jgi:hypothetical protein
MYTQWVGIFLSYAWTLPLFVIGVFFVRQGKIERRRFSFFALLAFLSSILLGMLAHRISINLAPLHDGQYVLSRTGEPLELLSDQLFFVTLIAAIGYVVHRKMGIGLYVYTALVFAGVVYQSGVTFDALFASATSVLVVISAVSLLSWIFSRVGRRR